MILNVSLCVDINPARNHLLTHLAVDLLEGGKAKVPVLGLDERLGIVGGHEELQQLRLTQSVLGARDSERDGQEHPLNIRSNFIITLYFCKPFIELDFGCLSACLSQLKLSNVLAALGICCSLAVFCTEPNNNVLILFFKKLSHSLN